MTNVEIESQPLYDQIVEAQKSSPEYQTTRQRWHRLQTGDELAQVKWQKTVRDEYVVETDLI